MPQLNRLFPRDINRFIDPFVGGGSVFLNTNAKSYLVNDIDENIINLHKMLSNYDFNALISEISNLIYSYGLSFSLNGITAPNELKKQFVKTYYAKFNKSAYEKLRADYNIDKDDFLRLYVLLIYGFNRILRFNSKGDFNLPVGNVDFNQNVYEALLRYTEFTSQNSVKFHNLDYIDFLDGIKFKNSDYIYFDPPYLISNSEYNKLWSESNERKLYEKLDLLNMQGVKFGITNLIHHKGKTNTILQIWAKKYQIYNISSNYISFNDNTIKADSKEIFVTNLKANNA
ncbi:DNA adenine methylase [Campylobacter fetus subsp. testudinum]|uniref:Site-specific DNA-methyltransferase (adenine-specific) n=2 Tax=Campylobacter fetus TaxID=196 RepID=A0AAX0HCX5_CAMFE|nr:DNA adenine methylase [Campylobacter fetus subsp. testudinum]OCR93222.1 DNA adenine methylase [Campylobacter fetus subsp. testudinum]